MRDEATPEQSDLFGCEGHNQDDESPLDPEASRNLAMVGSPSDRAEYIRRVAIHTPSHDKALEIAQYLYHEAEGSAHPGGFALIGDSGSGKTYFSLALRALFKRSTTDRAVREPLGYLDLSQVPYNAITETMLVQLGSFVPKSATERELKLLLAKTMDAVDFRLLITDEAQRMALASGRARRPDQLAGPVGEWMKAMHNLRPFGHILMGMPDLKTLLQSESQLKTRWPGLIELPKIQCDSYGHSLICSIAQALPFPKPSDLARKSVAFAIIRVAHGSFRIIKNLIATAVQVASIDEADCVTVRHLERAIDLVCAGGVNSFKAMKG